MATVNAINSSDPIEVAKGGTGNATLTAYAVITGGSLASSDDFDSVEILCTTADTTWVVLSSKGNITIV